MHLRFHTLRMVNAIGNECTVNYYPTLPHCMLFANAVALGSLVAHKCREFPSRDKFPSRVDEGDCVHSALMLFHLYTCQNGFYRFSTTTYIQIRSHLIVIRSPDIYFIVQT